MASNGGAGSSIVSTSGGLTTVFLDQAVTLLEFCTRADVPVRASCVLDLMS
jgi:hypothetical protein